MRAEEVTGAMVEDRESGTRHHLWAAVPAGVQSGTARETPRRRPRIAFFDYPDVFEDFYPHYGVDQKAFATRWVGTGSHAFLSLLQREVGDVVWYAFSVAPQLDEARHEVIGCQVRILPSSWLHRRLWGAFYLPRLARCWRAAYPAYAVVASYVALASLPFVRALWRDHPDILFVQDYATGRFDFLVAIARALGIPLIAYHAGSRPERYLGRLAKRWSIPAADRLIVSSHAEQEMLARRYRVAPDRLALILTPIDTDIFRPIDRATACRAAELDAARRHLLFVGRLDDYVKRVSALIESFSAVAGAAPDADLLIVGDGRERPDLEQLAEQKAPGRVRFIGWVSEPARLAAFYNAAECLALPSRREGFPTVVGEAMACGTPVVAARVGGVGELVVDGETGWFLPPGDDEALTSALAAILADREAVAAMRPRARKMAETRVAHSVVAADLRRCFRVDNGPAEPLPDETNPTMDRSRHPGQQVT
jgi:glycosyltransferase involved in cell wall biosynthesis